MSYIKKVREHFEATVLFFRNQLISERYSNYFKSYAFQIVSTKIFKKILKIVFMKLYYHNSVI